MNVYLLRTAVSLEANTNNKRFKQGTRFAFCFCTLANTPFEGIN